MNKYAFIIMPSEFSAPPAVIYNEVEHKKLNENLEKIRILIMAKDIKEAFEKAKFELNQIIAVSFSEVPNIDNYVFRLRVIEIQNY